MDIRKGIIISTAQMDILPSKCPLNSLKSAVLLQWNRFALEISSLTVCIQKLEREKEQLVNQLEESNARKDELFSQVRQINRVRTESHK